MNTAKTKGMDHSKMEGMDHSKKGMGSHVDKAMHGFMTSMKTMDQAMMSAKGSTIDSTYARKMIAHHQGAIDMAKVELMHGSDASAKRLAQKTIDENTKGVVDPQPQRQGQGAPGPGAEGGPGGLLEELGSVVCPGEVSTSGLLEPKQHLVRPADELADTRLLGLHLPGVHAVLESVALPAGAPDPFAPPCIRHRFLPRTAGALHAAPLRVFAPHRGLPESPLVSRRWLPATGYTDRLS